MRNVLRIAFVLLWVVWNAPAASAQGGVDAIFAGGRGEIKKAYSIEWIRLTPQIDIRIGDEIRTGIDEEVLLDCIDRATDNTPDGKNIYRITIEPQTRFVLKEKCSEAEQNDSWVRHLIDYLGSLQLWLFENTYPPSSSGASRGGAPRTALLYPRAGLVLGNRPEFAWIPGERSQAPFRLEVKEKNGAVIFSRDNLRDTTLVIPEAESPFEVDAFYTVEVYSMGVNGWILEDSGEFVVVDSGIRRRLDLIHIRYLDESEDQLLGELAYVGHLMGEGFYTAAGRILHVLNTAYPEEPHIHRLLAIYYNKVGLSILLK